MVPVSAVVCTSTVFFYGLEFLLHWNFPDSLPASSEEQTIYAAVDRDMKLRF